jgi:hypothetical protein
VTDTSQDAAELQRLASEIIASSAGQPQPNTFVATVRVIGTGRYGRRRSRHCRSDRARSFRRARDRARTKEHEA